MKKSIQFLTLLLVAGTVLFTGCKKDDDDDDNNDPVVPPITVNSEPQLAFTADGTNYSFLTTTVTTTQYFSNSSLLATFPDSTETVFGSGFENLTNGIDIDFNKGTLKHVIPSDSAAFTNFFKKQGYSYSVDAVNGIEVRYNDANGDQWSSGFGTGDQAGSTFVILDRKPFSALGDKYMRVVFTFNCKVYNQAGVAKVITNGVGVTDFWAEY